MIDVDRWMDFVGVFAEECDALYQRVEELEGALEHTTRELEHWLAWKNGNAMHPQREKGESVVRVARQALEREPQK